MTVAPIAIVWRARAKSQLAKLGKVERLLIWNAVGGLSVLPWGPNVIALKSHRCGFRMRAGRFRVLFDFDGKLRIVSIEEVKKRDEQTY